MKKLKFIIISFVLLSNVSCENITVDTPSISINLYDDLVNKLCLGNKIRERERLENQVVSFEGEVLQIEKEYVRVIEFSRNYSLSNAINVYVDKSILWDLDPRQKIRVKGLLKLGNHECKTDSHYISNGIIY